MSADDPEGFLDVRLQARAARRARRHPGGTWGKPVRGTWVFAASDGTALAKVRTLGARLPRKDRRYSLQVDGVTFLRVVARVSAARPVRSELCAYRTPEAALDAGAALVDRLRNES